MSFHARILIGSCLAILSLLFSAQRAIAFDSQHIKIEVIVDDEQPRFPHPIFGFVVVTNQSDQEAFLPISEGGKLTFTIGGVQTQQILPTLGQTELRKVPVGFSCKIPFVFCVSTREQIQQILRDKASVDITFSIDAIPKRKVIAQQRRPDVIEFTEAGGFDWLESSPTKVYYNKKRNVFYDFGHFFVEVGKAKNWPPSDKPVKLSFVQFKPRPGVNSPSFGRIEDVGKDSFNYLPIAHAFPNYLRELQAEVKPTTATWRILELQRIQRTRFMRPETDRNLLRMVEDEIDVLRCAGRAESYFLDSILTQWEKRRVFLDGTNVFLPDYAYELKMTEIPFLRNRVDHSDLIRMIRGEVTYHFRVNPVLFQVPAERRAWQSAINDITMPSPRETTLQRWMDGGRQGPSPCYCWEDDEACEAEERKRRIRQEHPLDRDPFGGVR